MATRATAAMAAVAFGCDGEGIWGARERRSGRGERTGASGVAEQVEGEPEASPLSSPGEVGEVVGWRRGARSVKQWEVGDDRGGVVGHMACWA